MPLSSSLPTRKGREKKLQVKFPWRWFRRYFGLDITDGWCMCGSYMHATSYVCVRREIIVWHGMKVLMVLKLRSQVERKESWAKPWWNGVGLDGWMGGEIARCRAPVCTPLPSMFACFLHIALICLSCLLLLYRPSAAAVAGPGVLLTPCVPIVSLTRGQ
jgi:hypothetical protein